MKYTILILFMIGSQLTNEGRSVDPNLQTSTDMETVYNILNTKCNSCHKEKNPSKVFTVENMNGFAKRINKQVFVWKRMPKGNKIKLTNQEKAILKNWINTINPNYTLETNF